MKIISMCNARLQLFADNLQESLRRIGAEAIIHQLDDPPGEWGSQEFKNICYKKLDIITAELAKGTHLLYCDVDVVFRDNPIADLELQLLGTDADAVFQQEEPPQGPNHKQKGPHLFGAGFFAVKPTEAGKALVAPKGPHEENRWGWHSDAGLLGTRLLRHTPVAKAALLPTGLYPSGWYQLNTKLSAARIACHYNWTESMQSKIIRMKKEGDWLL